MTAFRVLLVLGLAGLTLAHPHDDGGFFGGRLASVMDPRLGINIARIIQLEKHIEHIREKLEEAKHVDPEQYVDDLNTRMNDLEESTCEEHEFECGEHGDNECISDLFVCDGHEDCHNHHDEDDEVCSTDPVHAGNIYTGFVHWTSCLEREDHVLHINIIGVKKFKFFPGRLIVRAIVDSIHNEGEEEVSETHDTRGIYDFAHRRLLLIPTDDEDELSHESLAIQCEFGFGHDESAECELIYQGSQHVCAEMSLTLEEEEEEDHDDDHSDAGHHGYYDTTGYEEEKEKDDHHDDHDDEDRSHHRKDKDHHDDDDDDHHRGKRRKDKHDDDDDDHHKPGHH